MPKLPMMEMEIKGNNTYQQDGLTFRKDERNGDYVINPTPEDLTRLEESGIGIKNIEINHTKGVIPKSLQYLARFNFIEGLAIIPLSYIDITFIHSLSNLRLLKLTRAFDQIIDFEKLPNLNYCQIEWDKKVTNLGTLKSLRTLFLTGYKAGDLIELKPLTELRELTIVNSTIKTLNGLEHLSHLEKLELFLLQKLMSLKGVEELHALKWLGLENCPNVNNIDALKTLVNLESLGIHDGKMVDTIKAIKELSNLQVIYLTGNTNVADGDMSPLIGRKDACFGTRRHYSHKAEEIDKINGTIRPKQTWEM